MNALMTADTLHETGLARADQLSQFKRSVRMVEIEVFSYCNRRCWFCPNSKLDRVSTNHYMDPALYTSILEQLVSISYEAMISYSRYNEPLADRIILDRVREARILLPKAILHTNTNGDYLTASYLAELRHAGLNSLNIQVYMVGREPYCHEKARARMEAIIRRLGLPAQLTADKEDEWIEAKLFYEDMKIRIYGRNFAVNGCDRGQSVPVRSDFVRTAPCPAPTEHFIIDYSGKVMPCCNLRSDLPEHRSAVIADLALNDDLFAAFSSPSVVEWRRRLSGYGEKGGVCRTCAFNL